jgi:hypothetical protein
MGKTSENLGDSFNGFRPIVSDDELRTFFNNLTGPIAASLLGNATTRIIYDITRHGGDATNRHQHSLLRCPGKFTL